MDLLVRSDLYHSFFLLFISAAALLIRLDLDSLWIFNLHSIRLDSIRFQLNESNYSSNPITMNLRFVLAFLVVAFLSASGTLAEDDIASTRPRMQQYHKLKQRIKKVQADAVRAMKDVDPAERERHERFVARTKRLNDRLEKLQNREASLLESYGEEFDALDDVDYEEGDEDSLLQVDYDSNHEDALHNVMRQAKKKFKARIEAETDPVKKQRLINKMSRAIQRASKKLQKHYR